ncbi:MAG: T9SS type A sorting domain-containing protein [Bacteroidota bacterium]
MKRFYYTLFIFSALFSSQFSFAQPDSCEFNQINVTLETQIWAAEMSWNLQNENGDIVASGENYADNSIYSAQFCLEDGCYTLNLFDSFGDGWNGGTITLFYAGLSTTFPAFLSGSNVSYSFGINDPGCDSTNILGCTDPSAINWNPAATIDDGSCIYQNDSIFGCTDSLALNWNPLAIFDDGSCVYDTLSCITGWIDGAPDGLVITIYAINNVYTVLADANGSFYLEIPAGETIQFGTFIDCNGNLTDILFEQNWFCWTSFSPPYCNAVFGCTDTLALNWNPAATIDDGSCQYSLDSCDYNVVDFVTNYVTFGAEMSWSLSDGNGNPIYTSAPFNNENTVYESLCLEDGCYTFEAFDSFGDGWNGGSVLASSINSNVNFYFSLQEGEYASAAFGVNDPNCVNQILGCTDSLAINFNPLATLDDGSCIYPGDTLSCVDGWITGAPDGTLFNIYTPDGEVYNVTSSNDGMFYLEIPYFPPGSTVLIEYADCTGQLVSIPAYSSSWNSCFSVDQPYCDQFLFGCTDPAALNWNPNAIIDDGSCIYANDSCDYNMIYVTTLFGAFASELSWNILDENGNVLHSSIPFSGNTVVLETVCLEDGCYTFEAIDAFGDGWNGGSVSATDANGQIIFEYTLDQGEYGIWTFGVNEPNCSSDIYGCTDPWALNYNAFATIDDGSCIYECDSGLVAADLYVCVFANGQEVGISITGDNGSVVYEQDGFPNNAIEYIDICLDPNVCYTVNMWNNTVPEGWYGGYYWINTNGSQISTGSLGAGQSEGFVQFSLDGSCGDVFGCTDPNALNYNADATIDDGSCYYSTDSCDYHDVFIQMYVIDNQWLPIIDFENENGGTIFSGTIWTTTYGDSFCLDDGCYYLDVLSVGAGNTGQPLVDVYVDGVLVETFYDIQGSQSSATIAVGSADCGPQEIEGCTDPFALNYNPDATIDDGSCIYTVVNDLCEDATPLSTGTSLISNIGAYQNEGMDGDCWGFGNGEEEQTSIWFEFTTPGYDAQINIVSSGDGTYSLTDTQFGIYEECGDEMIYCDGNSGDGLFAAFYLECGALEPSTTYLLQVDGWSADEGTCFLTYEHFACDSVIFGCTDSTAINFDPLANFDDGSCIYEEECEAYFEIIQIDSIAGVVFIENYSSGDNLAYFWDFGDGSTSTDEFPIHEYEQEGSYLLCLTIYTANDPQGYCESTYCQTIEYYSPGFLPSGFWINVVPPGTVDINELNPIQNLNVYPNPAEDFVTIEFNSIETGQLTLELFDISGRLLDTQVLNSSNGFMRQEVNLSQYERGSYVLRLRHGAFSNTARFTLIR